MAVRNTESQIPGGFSLNNAKKLGFATENVPNGDYILVSYLGKTLRQGREEIAYNIKNTYVVFVNTKKQPAPAEPQKYECVFKFFIKDQPAPLEHSLSSENRGIFNLNTEEISALENKIIEKINVSMTLVGIGVTLSMEHTVEGLEGDIEALFEANDEAKNAVGGNPSITRLLGNDYRLYLREYTNSFEKSEFDTPPNLVAAVIYLHLLNNSLESQEENLELWETYLNKEIIDGNHPEPPNELKKIPLGIAHIRPYLLAMFLEKLNGIENGTVDKGLIGIINWSGDKDHGDYEEDVFKSFVADTTRENKIDIFNLLKFPRSAIFTCAAYLKALQQNSPGHSEWRSLSNVDLMENEESIRTIVSEYKRGPSQNLEDYTEIGEKVYSTMFTKYIETIIERDYIEYYTIKIKALDIRSGKPLKNKKVKKLLIHGVNGTDKKYFGVKNEGEFLYNREKIQVSQSVRAAQIALLRLGYAPSGVDRNDKSQENPDKWCDNGWGGQTAQAYNDYWFDRLLNNSLNQTPDKKPDSYFLTRIKDDYNSSAYTNDLGIVEIKIPLEFLNNRKVYIDIGFWEFPIVLEELKDDDRDAPITRPQDSDEIPAVSATDFKISWGDSQKAEWGDYLDDAGNYKEDMHFGWSVKDKDDNCESKLKAWQRIIVKDDTGPFEEWDEDLLSKYYETTGEHFVLFGMQWCQPVWDDIDDAKSHTIGSVSLKSYIQNEDYAGLHLHLATLRRDIGGSEQYGGKGYGKYELPGAPTNWRDQGGHQGYDIHVLSGQIVFALHGGIVNSVDSRPKYKAGDVIPAGYSVGDIKRGWENHISIGIKWKSVEVGEHTIYSLFHLQNRLVNVSDILYSGQIVGKGGRTGNIGLVSEWPTHVHVNVGNSGQKYNPRLTQTLQNIYPENRACLPNNEEFPLMMPCWCEVTQEDSNPRTCAFRITAFVNKCWAAAELKCPYMYDIYINNKIDTMIIQAQLRYINEKPVNPGDPFKENNNPEYLHPGNIDGDDEGIVPGGMINLHAGDQIKADSGEISFDDGDYRRVKKGTIVGWALRSGLGTWNDATKEYTLEADLSSLLHGGRKKKEFSKTRLAIYRVREKAKKDDNSNFLKTGNENNWENYQVMTDETDLLNKLFEKAPITEPESQ